ncbi:MAG: glycosyltransferase family 2 protein [Candidatus Odinarchaeota archaeon]
MKGLVSVIILNYNNYKFTIDCLKSLTHQNYKNFEVVLVDNGSKYNLFLKLKEQLEQFKSILRLNLIRSEKNLYFGAGNNKAIKIAKGEYICLLNYDTEVMPNFLQNMVEFLEKNPQVGMISPKIKLFSKKELIWTTAGQVNFNSGDVVTNRGFLISDPDDKIFNKIEPIDFAPGTALFVRKAYLEQIGLIDEIYFMYWEDPDWNFRAKELGYASYYVPTTIVYHKIPILRSIYDRRQIFNDFFFKRNIQIFVWKFASIEQIFKFYIKFFIALYFEVMKRLRRKEFFVLYVTSIAIWKGFRIGLKRRTHRSCRKNLIKDYYFVQKLQNVK